MGLALVCLCLRLAWAYQRPHILFIMADDLGWNDVGWHSTDGIATPALAALAAAHATLLNNSYVAQLCSPSRTLILFQKGRAAAF